ncbi:MAG TPA: hypothetical protein VJ838_12240 [Gaiellaceae bacterium]|nr:hypothetical protein [Gaiellaceae bacterium]
MNARSDRLFAICGIAFVALQLGGTFLAMAAGKTHDLTIGSSTSGIARAIAHPVGAGVWAGAYMEMLSVCFFLAFAVWAAERLGGGLLGSTVKLAAAATAGGGIVSLGIINVISYRAGHGMNLDVAKTLVTTGEAVYVGTWFLNATLLTAASLLALRAGRRPIAWSALAIVVYTLVLTPLSVDNAGQFSQILYLLWVVATSIALARRSSVPAPGPVAAAAAQQA